MIKSVSPSGHVIFFLLYEIFTVKFRSGQKQKQLKAPRARTIENHAKMLKADWFKNDHTCVDKIGIATGESGDKILLPLGIQLYFI